MEYKHERAAYKSLLIPQDLSKKEHARYLMLCLIYRQYREGDLYDLEVHTVSVSTGEQKISVPGREAGSKSAGV